MGQVGRTLLFPGLVPAEWQHLDRGRWPCAFNPGMIRHRGHLLMAYRVVLADGRRRLAICRLSEEFEPVPGTVLPLSDLVEGAEDWMADPRFLALGENLYLHFNNGSRRPNQIHLVALDARTLFPIGPARALGLSGQRQVVEKNWGLFEGAGGEALGVYRIAPHVVIRLNLDGSAEIPCERIHEIPWMPSRYRHGAPRGGTPPVKVGEVYFSFFHSVQLRPWLPRALARAIHGRWERKFSYAVGFYGFSAHPPFQPVCYSPGPVLEAPARRRGDADGRLNPFVDRVAYPCGAILERGRWTLSYGLHDAHCMLATFDHQSLLAAAVPVGPLPSGGRP